MILKNIILQIFKVFHSLFNYCTRSPFHLFEVVVLLLHAVIIAKLWGMVSTKAAFGNEELGQTDIDSVVNFIGKTNTIANYIGNFDFLLATSILLMFFRSIQIFEVSLSANLPISTMKAGTRDILNWLVIFTLVMLGAAISGYIVFCPSIVEFQTV